MISNFQRMAKNSNIPIASDLVTLGNPQLKVLAQECNSTPSHIDELNSRIDDLESAIGQDASGPIGRAFAIRVEATSSHKDAGHISEKDKMI